MLKDSSYYRDMAKASRTKLNSEIEVKLIEAIQAASTKGKTSCFVYFSLSDAAVKALEEKGFMMSNLTTQRDGVLWRIDWTA